MSMARVNRAPDDQASATVDIPRLGELAGVPLYEVVKRHISEAIVFGRWPPGTVLPGEIVLAKSFGIAVGTVRRALAELTAEGLLTRRRKTGTIVTGRSPHHSLRSFFQYFRLHGADGSLVRSRAKIVALGYRSGTDDECRRLDIADGDAVLRIQRVRIVDGTPIMRDQMVIAAARIPDFPTSAEKVPELLYLHLLERYGIRISAVRERMTAALAEEDDLRLLQLASPAALLVIDEIAYDQAGRPTILAVHRARTDRHCYVNEVR
jgi:GntR family transcriptional regulator